VRTDATTGARIVAPWALKRVIGLFTKSPEDLPHFQSDEVIKSTQNALSDWGAKRVAVIGAPATTHLTQNTLTAHNWALAVASTCDLVTSDPSAAITEIIDRVARSHLAARTLWVLRPTISIAPGP
jgi:hypothetical protein